MQKKALIVTHREDPIDRLKEFSNAGAIPGAIKIFSVEQKPESEHRLFKLIEKERPYVIALNGKIPEEQLQRLCHSIQQIIAGSDDCLFTIEREVAIAGVILVDAPDIVKILELQSL